LSAAYIDTDKDRPNILLTQILRYYVLL